MDAKLGRPAQPASAAAGQPGCCQAAGGGRRAAVLELAVPVPHKATRPHGQRTPAGEAKQ